LWVEGIARLEAQPTISAAILIHGLRQQWLTWLSRSPEVLAATPTLPGALVQAVQIAQQQPSIGPEQLAQTCGCSLVTLRRRFLAHFDMTPGKWLSEQRLQRAAHLLRTSSDTVRDIAEMAGFSDERYLHQCFRARYGCTPLTYREGGP
jgi:transcriptional regulator GlxA family with amidase domain